MDVKKVRSKTQTLQVAFDDDFIKMVIKPNSFSVMDAVEMEAEDISSKEMAELICNTLCRVVESWDLTWDEGGDLVEIDVTSLMELPYVLLTGIFAGIGAELRVGNEKQEP